MAYKIDSVMVLAHVTEHLRGFQSSPDSSTWDATREPSGRKSLEKSV